MQDQALARRLATVKEIALFAGLPEKELITMVEDLRPKEYKRDELIFRQGDESHEVYILLKGKVRIYKISPGGDETTVALYSTHDVIGELAALDNEARSATGKAMGPVTLLAMSQERFLYHLRSNATLALNLARVIAQKLRWRSAYAESIAQFDAAGRLLHILLENTTRFGEVVEPGKRYTLNLALNQSDLASMVGARREWVNRILSDWRKRGLLDYENGVITIFDLPRVQAERDSRIEANSTSADW
ncbi:MAG: Crp/Fnr family transcriptional regulator, partial [Chloroflexota bacterium]|nr:Crp/Fnr family transcriptional regulator [Chloroflexota bacterium]